MELLTREFITRVAYLRDKSKSPIYGIFQSVYNQNLLLLLRKADAVLHGISSIVQSTSFSCPHTLTDRQNYRFKRCKFYVLNVRATQYKFRVI